MNNVDYLPFFRRTLWAVTQLVERDTEGTVSAWQAARAQVIEPSISAWTGRLVKLTSDEFLVEFSTVQDAVQCAIEVKYIRVAPS